MAPEDIASVAAMATGEALKKFLRGSPLTAADARRFWGHPRGGRVARVELEALDALLARATVAAAEGARPEGARPEGLPKLSVCHGLYNLHRLLRGRFEAEVLAGG